METYYFSLVQEAVVEYHGNLIFKEVIEKKQTLFFPKNINIKSRNLVQDSIRPSLSYLDSKQVMNSLLTNLDKKDEKYLTTREKYEWDNIYTMNWWVKHEIFETTQVDQPFFWRPFVSPKQKQSRGVRTHVNGCLTVTKNNSSNIELDYDSKEIRGKSCISSKIHEEIVRLMFGINDISMSTQENPSRVILYKSGDTNPIISEDKIILQVQGSPSETHISASCFFYEYTEKNEECDLENKVDSPGGNGKLKLAESTQAGAANPNMPLEEQSTNVVQSCQAKSYEDSAERPINNEDSESIKTGNKCETKGDASNPNLSKYAMYPVVYGRQYDRDYSYISIPEFIDNPKARHCIDRALYLKTKGKSNINGEHWVAVQTQSFLLFGLSCSTASIFSDDDCNVSKSDNSNRPTNCFLGFAVERRQPSEDNFILPPPKIDFFSNYQDKFSELYELDRQYRPSLKSRKRKESTKIMVEIQYRENYLEEIMRARKESERAHIKYNHSHILYPYIWPKSKFDEAWIEVAAMMLYGSNLAFCSGFSQASQIVGEKITGKIDRTFTHVVFDDEIQATRCKEKIAGVLATLE